MLQLVVNLTQGKAALNTLIITFGSHGDVQPYVVLGLALQAAGHAVTICTAEQSQPFVQEHGLANGCMNGALLKLVDTGDIFHTTAGQAIPILHGCSRHIVPRPADWPGPYSFTRATVRTRHH